MNLNIVDMIGEMSVEQIENLLASMAFSESEMKFFIKSKELIDQGFEMKVSDSGQKLLTAAVLYYVMKCKINKNKI